MARKSIALIPIFLVLILGYKIPAWPSETCTASLKEVKILGTHFGDLADFKERILNENQYNQARTISEVIRRNPPLISLFAAAKPGTVIVDFGAGAGAAVATAAYSMESLNLPKYYGNFQFVNITEEDAALMTKFKFLGITGISGGKLLVPAVDPKGKYKVLHSRIFEEIPSQELDAALLSLTGGVREPIIGYSMMGIFEYTPAPDIALEKMFQMFRPGDLFYLKNNRRILVQTESGKLISLAEYAEHCGFERKKAEGGSILKKTAEAYHRIPLTLISGNFDLPPFYLLRMQRQTFSELQKFELDRAALKAIASNKVDLDVMKMVIPGYVQLGETIGSFDTLAWKTSEYMDHFANRLQGFDPRAVEMIFPGENSQTFSGWAAIDKNKMAVEYFDAHRDFFHFDSDFAIFFEGLRDILNGETKTLALEKLQNVLSHYLLKGGSDSKAENMGEFLLSIVCPEELELLRDENFISTEKMSRNQAINALNRAWIHSTSARNWLKSNHVQCPWN